MPDRVTYEYAVIRVVPRVEREEFLNLGVILFSKRKRFLDMRYRLDEDRMRAAFPEDLDLPLLRQHLEAWEQVCAGRPRGGPIGALEQPERFRWLTATRSTIIQSSAVHPGLCEEPERVLEKLFEYYVY